MIVEVHVALYYVEIITADNGDKQELRCIGRSLKDKTRSNFWRSLCDVMQRSLEFITKRHYSDTSDRVTLKGGRQNVSYGHVLERGPVRCRSSRFDCQGHWVALVNTA